MIRPFGVTKWPERTWLSWVKRLFKSKPKHPYMGEVGEVYQVKIDNFEETKVGPENDN